MRRSRPCSTLAARADDRPDGARPDRLRPDGRAGHRRRDRPRPAASVAERLRLRRPCRRPRDRGEDRRRRRQRQRRSTSGPPSRTRCARTAGLRSSSDRRTGRATSTPRAACSASSPAARSRTTAVGVKVSSTRTWSPYFLGIVGFSSWSASADADGQGRLLRRRTGRQRLPGRHRRELLQDLSVLLGQGQLRAAQPVLPAAPDAGQPQRPGRLRMAQVRLRRLSAWARIRRRMPAAVATRSRSSRARSGRPPTATAAVPLSKIPGSADKIGNLPGNKVSADCSYYIDNQITVTVPGLGHGGRDRARTPGTTSSASPASS